MADDDDLEPAEDLSDPALAALVEMEEADKLTPEAVVQAATDPDHPLHERVFDCDDDEAAHRWRLHRARQMIRSYTVIRLAEGGDQVRYRKFTHVRSEGRYVDTDRALRDWRDEVLERARRDMRTFSLKYKALGKAALLDLAAEVLEQ